VAAGGEEGLEDPEVPPEAVDLGGELARAGVGTGDGNLDDAQAESRRANGQVIVQLVGAEARAERRHARVEQEPAAIGAEAVGRVGITEAGSEADQRGVQEMDAEQSGPGGVDSAPALDEARALDVVVPGYECADEAG
jgi:hypothetical protein